MYYRVMPDSNLILSPVEENELLPPVQVRTAGEIANQRYHSTPGTRDGDMMLFIFLEGKGYYEYRGSVTPVRANTLALIPDTSPGILYADHVDPYRKMYCRFSGVYARYLVRSILVDRGNCFFPDQRAAALAEKIRKMSRIHRKDLPAALTEDGIILLEILSQLEHALELPCGRLSGADIENYLREHISNPTDLDRIAADLGVSRSTLCRTARRGVGKTVQEIHQAMKVDWAKHLLSSGSMGVAEVAYRAGYGDPYYFSRVFKKTAGIGPRNWKNRNR